MIVILLAYISQELFALDELYYSSLGEQLSYERIEEFLFQKQKWAWVGYALIPMIYLLKFSLIALCLNIGTVLINYKISFKKLFQIVMIAEAVFLLPAMIKIGWFVFVQTDYTLTDLQYFYPLSLLSFFNTETLEAWWLYPFQVLNLFEVLYWLVLAFGLHLVLKKTLNQTLGLVLSSYGVGLLLWIVFVTFLTINMS